MQTSIALWDSRGSGTGTPGHMDVTQSLVERIVRLVMNCTENAAMSISASVCEQLLQVSNTL